MDRASAEIEDWSIYQVKSYTAHSAEIADAYFAQKAMYRASTEVADAFKSHASCSDYLNAFTTGTAFSQTV